MIYVVTINDKEYEVDVELGKANIIKTTVVTAPAAQAVPAPAAAPVSVPVSQPEAIVLTGKIVKSPMPGTILDIRVQPGQAVKKGDILLILEAMKMENEILSSADGVVKQIVVAKNAIVSTGDALVVIQ